MPMAVPRPVTLDDVTYVFERGRWCYNSTYGRTRHCDKRPAAQFRLHGRQRVTLNLDRPVTLTIKVCGCVECGHEPLDRDVFIEAEWTVSVIKWRRQEKERYQGASGYEARRKACTDACDGVDTADLKPGMLRVLLDA